MKTTLLIFTAILSISPFIAHAQWTTGTVDINNTNTGNIGIGTPSPTHTLTFGSGSTGMAMYNTSGQTTTFERIRQYWSGNIYNIASEAAGDGIIRPLKLGITTSVGSSAISSYLLFNPSVDIFDFVRSTSLANVKYISTAGMASTASSGTSSFIAAIPTVNQSGTAGYRGLWISPYEQATGTGGHYLIDAGTNSAANGTGTYTSKFVVTSAGNVGIGTATPAEALSVNGNIRSKQVKVETANWPDYVFKPQYNLPSLAEVKTYIEENQHLPEMPSEQEIAKDGLNLGEIVKLQTKKIEELTLYLIEKDKEMKAQQDQLNKLSSQLEKIASAGDKK